MIKSKGRKTNKQIKNMQTSLLKDYKFKNVVAKKNINYTFTVTLDSVYRKKPYALFLKMASKTIYRTPRVNIYNNYRAKKNFQRPYDQLNTLKLKKEMQSYLTRWFQIHRQQVRLKTATKIINTDVQLSNYKKKKLNENFNRFTNNIWLNENFVKAKLQYLRTYAKLKRRRNDTFGRVAGKVIKVRIQVLKKQLKQLDYRKSHSKVFPISYYGPSYKRQILFEKKTKSVLKQIKYLKKNNLLWYSVLFAPHIQHKKKKRVSIFKRYYQTQRRKNQRYQKNKKFSSNNSQQYNKQNSNYKTSRQYFIKKRLQYLSLDRSKVKRTKKRKNLWKKWKKSQRIKKLQLKVYRKVIATQRKHYMREITSAFIKRLTDFLIKQKKLKVQLQEKIQTIVKNIGADSQIHEQFNEIDQLQTLSVIQNTIKNAVSRQVTQLKTKIRLSVQPAKVKIKLPKMKQQFKLLTSRMQYWRKRQELRKRTFKIKGHYVYGKAYRRRYLPGYYSIKKKRFIKGYRQKYGSYRRGYYKAYNQVRPQSKKSKKKSNKKHGYWEKRYTKTGKRRKIHKTPFNRVNDKRSKDRILVTFAKLRFVNTRGFVFKKAQKLKTIKSQVINAILTSRRNKAINQILKFVTIVPQSAHEINQQLPVNELFNMTKRSCAVLNSLGYTKRLRKRVAKLLVFKIKNNKKRKYVQKHILSELNLKQKNKQTQIIKNKLLVRVLSNNINEFFTYSRRILNWLKFFQSQQTVVYKKIVFGNNLAKSKQRTLQQLNRTFTNSLLKVSSLILQESNNTFTMKDQLKQSFTAFLHQNSTGMLFTKQKQLSRIKFISRRIRNKRKLRMVIKRNGKSKFVGLGIILRAHYRRVRQLNMNNSKLQPIVESIGMTGKLINGEEAPVFPLNNWMNVIKNKTQLAVIADGVKVLKVKHMNLNMKKLYKHICLKNRYYAKKKKVMKQPKKIVFRKSIQKFTKSNKRKKNKVVSYNHDKSRRKRTLNLDEKVTNFQKTQWQKLFLKRSVSKNAYLQILANFDFGNQQTIIPDLLVELQNQIAKENETNDSNNISDIDSDTIITTSNLRSKNLKHVVNGVNEVNYKYSKLHQQWRNILLLKKRLRKGGITKKKKALIQKLLENGNITKKGSIYKRLKKVCKVINVTNNLNIIRKPQVKKVRKTRLHKDVKERKVEQKGRFKKKRFIKIRAKSENPKWRKKKRKRSKGRRAKILKFRKIIKVPYFIRPRIINQRGLRKYMQKCNARRLFKVKLPKQQLRIKKKQLSKVKKAQIVLKLLNKYFKNEEKVQIVNWLQNQKISQLKNKRYVTQKVKNFLKEYIKACYVTELNIKTLSSRQKENKLVKAYITTELDNNTLKGDLLEVYGQVKKQPNSFQTQIKKVRKRIRTVKRKQNWKPRKIRSIWKLKKSRRKVLERIRSIYSKGVKSRFKYKKRKLSLKRSKKISRKIIKAHRRAKKAGVKINKHLIIASYYYYFKKLRYDRIVLDKLNYKQRHLSISNQSKSKLSKFLLYLLMRVYLKKSLYKRTNIRKGLRRLKQTSTKNQLAVRLKILGKHLKRFTKGITSQSKKYIGAVKKTILIKVLIKVLRSLLQTQIRTKKDAKRRRKIKEIIKIFLYPLLINKRQIQKVRLRKKNKIYLLMAQIFLYNVKQLVTSVNYSINFFGITGSSITAEYVLRRLRERLMTCHKHGGWFLTSIQKKLMRSKHVVGFKLKFSGRITGNSMAQKNIIKKGIIGNSNMNVYIDFAQDNIVRKHGKCGLKLWIVRNLLTYMPYKYVYTYNFKN
uniref:Ribosomal protein S3 n=1 Tax=Dictyostelium citrinum TaxID=361072 RepID=B2VQ35_DICCI|nr:ribosomal protein S3 [Dictyostelium citrinum]ACD12717.1 ribosomal protein S3 [Dictyostelium citrinum]